MAEVYVSADVEADGPIPGPHSMLSFTSAAFRADKTLIATFEANLTLLPGATGDPKTMEWWHGQPEAWAACRSNPRDPVAVMLCPLEMDHIPLNEHEVVGRRVGKEHRPSRERLQPRHVLVKMRAASRDAAWL
jgi:hypothetical protein